MLLLTLSLFINSSADKEPHKTKFYEGIKEAIQSFGNRIVLYDKITMYLAEKP